MSKLILMMSWIGTSFENSFSNDVDLTALRILKENVTIQQHPCFDRLDPVVRVRRNDREFTAQGTLFSTLLKGINTIPSKKTYNSQRTLWPKYEAR